LLLLILKGTLPYRTKTQMDWTAIIFTYLAIVLLLLYIKLCGDAKWHRGGIIQRVHRLMTHTVPQKLKYAMIFGIANLCRQCCCCATGSFRKCGQNIEYFLFGRPTHVFQVFTCVCHRDGLQGFLLFLSYWWFNTSIRECSPTTSKHILKRNSQVCPCSPSD